MKKYQDHQHHADRYARIGNIKYRPRPDVQEISDVSLIQPIKQVAQSTAELQTERKTKNERLRTRSPIDPQEHTDREDCNKAQYVAVALE